MSFSSKLELRMTWHERRVRWRNLRAKPNLNRVPQFMPQVLLCTILLRSFLFWVFCMDTNQHASTWCPVEQLDFEFVCMIFSNMDLQRFLFWRTVSQWSQATREASGNIWAPTIIFSNSPLSDQTIVDQQVAENYIWIILDFKAALTVERKAAAIPAPPEEAVEVVDWNFFFQGWSYHRWIYFIYLIIQVAYYSGAENPVTYTRNFKNTFACVFDLKKYPFDTQVDWQKSLCFVKLTYSSLFYI